MAAASSSSALRLLSSQQVSCEACAFLLAKRAQARPGPSRRRTLTASTDFAASPLRIAKPTLAFNPVLFTERRSHAASPRQTRSLHTTPSRSFTLFGYKKKADDPDVTLQTFLDALEAQDAEAVGQSYLQLRKIFLADPDLEPTEYLPVEHITASMELLSQTSFINDDFNVLRMIFQDLDSLWRVDEPSDRDCNAYFRGLMNSGRWRKAAKILSGKGPGRLKQWQPTSEAYNAYLQAYSESRGGSYRAAKNWALGQIPKEKRNLDTYLILLKALFITRKITPNENNVQVTIQWIQAQCADLHLDELQRQRLQAAILNGYTSLDDAESARQAQEALLALGQNVDDLASEAQFALVRYDSLINNEGGLPRNAQGALQVSLDLRQDITMQFFQDICSSESRHSHALDDLRSYLSQVESITGMLPDYKAYEQALRLAPSFEDAIALLRDSQRDGVSLTAGMLRAIAIKVGPAQATPEHTEILQILYRDLTRSKVSDDRSEDGIYNSALYIVLLQYCARADVADLAWATTLMEDMKAHGLTLLSGSEVVSRSEAEAREDVPGTLVASTSAASIVVALMKHAAKDHSQAFKAYSWMWAIDPENIFSKQDWYDVVRTYTEFRFNNADGTPRGSYVPATIFFAFFEDMRKAGSPPDSPVYQTILQYYAEEGAAFKNASANAVQHIHNLIKMDHYHDPDTGLMNRLMYAYSKTGNPDKAIGVWRSILINRLPFNNVSISIVLDAYGYLKDYAGISRVWKALRAQDSPQQLHPVNKKNFESYIEALCRSDRIAEAAEEAISVLQRKGVPGADEQALVVILKFARTNANLFHDLRKRIEQSLPHLWPAVKNFGMSKMSVGPQSDMPKTLDFRSLSFNTEETQGRKIELNSPSVSSFQKV